MKAKVHKRATIILTKHECSHLISYDMENRGNSEWESFWTGSCFLLVNQFSTVICKGKYKHINKKLRINGFHILAAN